MYTKKSLVVFNALLLREGLLVSLSPTYLNETRPYGRLLKQHSHNIRFKSILYICKSK